MQCFELTDRGVTRGIRVQFHPEPHVDVAPNGDFYSNLDKKLYPLLRRAEAATKDRRSKWYRYSVRLEHLTIVTTAEDEYMTVCQPTKEALVCLGVSAAHGGKVFIEASNDRGEKCNGDEIVSSFGPFPSLGISILGKQHWKDQEKPWKKGASRIELALVMMKGASFRIFRTVAPSGVQRVTYVKWTGSILDVTRPMKREPFEGKERVVEPEYLSAAQ